MGYYMAGGEYQVEARGSGGATFEDEGYIGKRPSMNKWNGRALSRAIRRTKGFVKMARKAVAYAHTAKLKGRRR